MPVSPLTIIEHVVKEKVTLTYLRLGGEILKRGAIFKEGILSHVLPKVKRTKFADQFFNNFGTVSEHCGTKTKVYH